MDDNDGGILYADIASEKAVIEDAKRDGRRRKIIRELFVTEKAFQTHLELIHKVGYFLCQIVILHKFKIIVLRIAL